MTIDEAIKCLKQIEILKFKDKSETYFFDDVNDALNLAIKALEQQPCEDCISRQAVLYIINFENKWLYDANSHNADTKIAFSTINYKIFKMPSVTPKYTDEEIDRAQAVEQAYVDKMVELTVEEWRKDGRK